MAAKTLKALSDEVASANENGITNRETFEAGVPLILAGKARIKKLREGLKAFEEALDKLGEKCRVYAFEHDSVQTSYDVHPDGVISVESEINENTYHVAYCFANWKRDEDGKKLDQPFLATLPQGYAKAKLELVDSVVTKAWEEDPTAVEELGLTRPRKTVWSLKLSSDLCDVCAA